MYTLQDLGVSQEVCEILALIFVCAIGIIVPIALEWERPIHGIKFRVYHFLAKSRKWCNTPTGERWVSRIGFAVTLVAAINIILLMTGLFLS